MMDCSRNFSSVYCLRSSNRAVAVDQAETVVSFHSSPLVAHFKCLIFVFYMAEMDDTGNDEELLSLRIKQLERGT